MNDSKNKMLMKVASNSKAPELLANVCVAQKLTKIARQQAVKDFTLACAMNKKADFGSALNGAWEGIQDWWKNDANKAGLATGALGALGTYGLTGMVPGLRRNQALRLALSAAGGFGGYKGGQWGANKLMSDANAKGQLAQAAVDAEAANQQAGEWNAERGRLQAAIDAAKAKAEQDKATIGGLKGDLAGANKSLEAAKAQAKADKADLAVATTERDALKATTDPKNVNYLNAGKALWEKRVAEGQALENAEFKKKLDGFLSNLFAGGKLSTEDAAAQIAAMEQQMAAAKDPQQQEWLSKAIEAIKANTVAPAKAKPTFSFGNR